MKKALHTLLIILLSNIAFGEVVHIENFDYDAGSNLEGQGIAPAIWAVSSNNAGHVSPIVANGPLTFTNYAPSGTGNGVMLQSAGTAHRHSFQLFSNETIYTSGDLYMAFLLNVTSAQSAWRDFLTFEGSATGTTQRGRIFTRSDGTGYKLTVTHSGTSPSSELTGLVYGTTYLVVMKYSLVEGASNDIVSLYADFPIGKAENSAEVVAKKITSSDNGSADPSGIRAITFKQRSDNSNILQVSNIRVATTWEEAVNYVSSAPALTAPEIIQGSNITESGFDANWSTVSNAVGYKINVYRGASIVKTEIVSSGSTSTVTITGLPIGGTYTYKVVAVGDNIGYSDSDESTESSAITLPIVEVVSIDTDFGDGTWGETQSSSPASGSYPSGKYNGFNLVNTVLLASSSTCIESIRHTNRVLLDKASTGAVIELPVLKTVGELEIHAHTGSEDMSFRVEELVDGTWITLYTESTTKAEQVYRLEIKRNSSSRLRIANNTGSGLYIYKIKSRTYREMTELNLSSSIPAEGSVIFNNLTKNVVLNFNFNVQLGNGDITIVQRDGTITLPANTYMIDGKTVTIPVDLPGFIDNRPHTLNIPAGAFTEKNNAINASSDIVVNFSTYRVTQAPANYNVERDRVYSTVDGWDGRMDIYWSKEASTSTPLIINIHGGGWSSGEKESQGGFNSFFNEGYAVANVEYRLRDVAKAPAAIQDIRAALIYMLVNADTYNIDPAKVIIKGGSAGAHLAMMCGYLNNNRLFDQTALPYNKEIKVLGIIDNYGINDFRSVWAQQYSSIAAWCGDRYSDQEFVYSLAPIEYITPATPPTYVVHGTADPTIPYEQSVGLVAKLAEAGVKHKFTTITGGGHGGFTTEQNNQISSEVMEFISELLNITTSVSNTTRINSKITIANKQLSIEDEQPITGLYIFNTQGQLVTYSNSNSVSLANVSKGVYLTKVVFSNKTETIKFVINN